MNISLNPFPILTTEHLILRKLDMQDKEEVLQLRSDDRVNAYLDRDKAVTIQDAIDFIGKIKLMLQNGQGIYWVITLTNNDKLIGTIGCWNFDLANNSAEIGYEILPNYHGQGIMQEVLGKVIEYGFGKMQLEEINACSRMDNINSIKLLERNGFRLDNADTLLSKDEPGNYLNYHLKKPQNQ